MAVVTIYYRPSLRINRTFINPNLESGQNYVNRYQWM